jgi:hypothetical protein
MRGGGGGTPDLDIPLGDDGGFVRAHFDGYDACGWLWLLH